MNRIVITFILLVSSFCLSGCISASYESSMKVGFEVKNPFEKKKPRPIVRGNGYPYSPRVTPALLASVETVDAHYLQQKSTEPKRRGFKKFKR